VSTQILVSTFFREIPARSHRDFFFSIRTAFRRRFKLISMLIGIHCFLGSSLLADFIHTAALFVIILFFMFQVYTSNEKIGSVKKMYDGLVQAGRDYPIEGNLDGSYLTFRSKGGLIFMVINLCTNLGTTFLDQCYWARALLDPSMSIQLTASVETAKSYCFPTGNSCKGIFPCEFRFPA
jgi:hypothetical protein